VEVLETRESKDVIEVAAQYRRKMVECPRCGAGTSRIHQTHRQWKRDARLWEKPVWVILYKRRFRCLGCGKVFTEADPACGRGRRTTRRLRVTVGRLAQKTTVRAAARLEGVSEGLVERSWAEEHASVRPPVRSHVLLGLDGFCLRKPGRMWTGMWDLETKEAVAFIAGERIADVQRMLDRHASPETVRAVAIDLSEAYRQAVELVLPDALVVADKFHVTALAGRALGEVRKERRRRGNVAWLLQRGVERLSAQERRRLLEVLSTDQALARAWALKEGLRNVYRKRSLTEAAPALDGWIKEAQASGLRPFQRTAATLKKWRLEVLNYWRCPITNALVEGKHNHIKTLKRRGYGYRNDRNFLLRILSQNHTD